MASDAVVPDVDGWWQEVNKLDVAGYAVIAATPTPVNGVLHRLSRAADHWKPVLLRRPSPGLDATRSVGPF